VALHGRRDFFGSKQNVLNSTALKANGHTKNQKNVESGDGIIMFLEFHISELPLKRICDSISTVFNAMDVPSVITE
jgi:hypothetical protein